MLQEISWNDEQVFFRDDVEGWMAFPRRNKDQGFVWERLFWEVFYHYQINQCGRNILMFMRLWEDLATPFGNIEDQYSWMKDMFQPEQYPEQQADIEKYITLL